MSRLFPRSPRSSCTLGVVVLSTAATLPVRAQDPAPAPADTAPVPATVSQTSWTTYKGNAQRTGSSNAKISLPLSLEWRYSSDGAVRAYTNSPLVVGAPGRQRIIFAAGRVVYALDAQTGQQVWKSTDLPASVGTPLTLLQGTEGDFVIAAQDNGRVSALDATRGSVKWTVDTAARIVAAEPIIATTPAGTRIICVVSSGKLIAIDSNGALDKTWSVSLDQFGVTPSSSMTLSGDGSRLFVPVTDGRVFVVDVAAARLLFNIRLSGRSQAAPAISGDNVITVTGNTVLASSVSNGRREWSFSAKGDVTSSPAVGSDQTVYYGTRTGFFQALDSAGKLKWEQNIGGNITGSPTVVGDVVLVGNSTGGMVALNTQSGAMQWSNVLPTGRVTTTERRFGGFPGGFGGFPGGDPGGGFVGGPPPGQTTGPDTRTYAISSAPAIVDGQVFVFADNGAMYGLTSKAIDADPARVVDPALVVPDSRNRSTDLELKPEAPPVIPGNGAIYFEAQLDDVGSGIDPTTITVTVDGNALASDRVDYEAASGSLQLTLQDPKQGDPSFEDGLKNIIIKMRDYAGNETTYQISFVVDKAAPAPEPKVDPNNPGAGGTTFDPGGGGFPG